MKINRFKHSHNVYTHIQSHLKAICCDRLMKQSHEPHVSTDNFLISNWNNFTNKSIEYETTPHAIRQIHETVVMDIRIDSKMDYTTCFWLIFVSGKCHCKHQKYNICLFHLICDWFRWISRESFHGWLFWTNFTFNWFCSNELDLLFFVFVSFRLFICYFWCEKRRLREKTFSL